MSAARWAAGLALSALVHAGGYGALMLAVRPDRVDEQPTPPSKLDVQSYQLDRTEAQERQPEAEAAAVGLPVYVGVVGGLFAAVASGGTLAFALPVAIAGGLAGGGGPRRERRHRAGQGADRRVGHADSG